jgi:hypothetical protein
VLDYLEATLDPAHVEEVRRRTVAALSYRPVDRPPVSLSFPHDEARWKAYPYAEAFDDPEKMMVNELLRSFGSIVNSAETRDDFPLAVRSNHGVGIVASLFGLRCRIVFYNMPWVDHVEDAAAVRRLVGRGLPDARGGLVARVLAAHQFYRETLAGYPVCRRCIRITQPDLQGPFDIAHLIWGADIYPAFYDEPDLVRALLDLVTEAYVAVWRVLRPTVDEGAGDGFIYLHGQIIRGNVLIKDDSCINLRPAMYRDFVRPCDARILEAVGSGGIHFCGCGDHLRQDILGIPGLRCLDFGQPEQNDFAAWQAGCAERRIALVRVLLDLLGTPAGEVRQRFPTGASLFYKAGTRGEAERYLAEARRGAAAV